MSHKSNNRSWSSQGRDGLPDSLQGARELREEFEIARDPSLGDSHAIAGKSNTERRGEQDAGSEMIRRDKPFPELRPKSGIAQQSICHSFNNRWHAEQKRASRRREHTDAFDQAKHRSSRRRLER